MRLLLVEDNEINQQIAVELLSEAGAIVTVAGHGKTAVELLLGNPQQSFDAVLMDVQMPVMDGFEASRLIRAQARFSDLPIIAMTAHALEEERQRCIAAGMNDHVSKPIDPEVLLLTLQRWKNHQSGVVTEIPVQTPAPQLASLSLPGFNCAAGLKRVNGKLPLYQDILHQFAEHQADTMSLIKGQVARKQWLEVARQLHTLKGTAANLGAEGIAEKAALLEQLVKTGQIDAVLLNQLELELQMVTKGITELAVQVPQSMPSSDCDPAMLARMCELLAEQNSEAIDFMLENEAALLNCFTAERYQVFARAVHQFDFPTALSLAKPIEEQP